MTQDWNRAAAFLAGAAEIHFVILDDQLFELIDKLNLLGKLGLHFPDLVVFLKNNALKLLNGSFVAFAPRALGSQWRRVILGRGLETVLVPGLSVADCLRKRV